ncbi:amino acid ABC transporter permease [Elioraea rosea]|uniref:amino acid ABC transporter permease n=1 Tax=Elioraea rosea TaxID=2492390 RepID=UPI0011831ED9|nr:amino acid ABC transporter permease [Elioraea rosea]
MSRDFELPELLFLIAALRWTIALSAVAFAGGFVGGFIVALARVSRLPVLRWCAAGYIGLVQGTPLLMQLFLAYFGLAVLTGVRLDPWPAVALAFTLYATAFLAEIWRGAIEAVPQAQWEAGAALALPRGRILRWIVLPQALRIAIPPTSGFLIQLIKGTSVASIIGFIELTRAGQLIVNVTFQPMTVYPVVAMLYFAVCWPLSLVAGRLERRFGRHQARVELL